MDLLERGRSIREVGRALSWFDVKTLFLHLPHNSHTRRLLSPDTVLDGELASTQSQLMGEVVDALTTLIAVTKGASPEVLNSLPKAIDMWRGVAEPGKKEPEHPAEEPPKVMTPADIRAEVQRRMGGGRS